MDRHSKWHVLTQSAVGRDSGQMRTQMDIQSLQPASALSWRLIHHTKSLRCFQSSMTALARSEIPASIWRSSSFFWIQCDKLFISRLTTAVLSLRKDTRRAQYSETPHHPPFQSILTLTVIALASTLPLGNVSFFSITTGMP